MKLYLTLLLVGASLTSHASDEDDSVISTSQLSSWCEINSKFILQKKGLTLHNWFASQDWQVDNFVINGTWKSDKGDQHVRCVAHRGAPKKLAVLKIQGEQHTIYNYKQRTSLVKNKEELMEWCKYRSASNLLSEGKSPYNWVASHWRAADHLYVKGTWKMDHGSEQVTCRALNRSNGATPEIVAD